MASTLAKPQSMTTAASPAATDGPSALLGSQNVIGNSSSNLSSQYASDYASRNVDEGRTVLNTLANSHTPSSSHAAVAAAMPITAHSPAPYSYADNNEPNTDSNNSNNNNNSFNYNAHDPERERERNAMSYMTAGPRPGAPAPATAASAGGRFTEDWDANQRGSSLVEGMLSASGGGGSGSGSADGGSVQLPTRTNTLKKKSSVRRSVSLHRSSSRRSVMAGSMRSLALQSRSDLDESRSAFFCPVPTKGNPTDTLANRFQAWRKILKDLISYHREIHNHYEQRAKSVQKLSASLNAAALPPGFIVSGGLDDATQVLRNFHQQVVVEATKAREIEDDVILALTGLRSDLNQKIKEIKNISGDFRNTVNKEMDATKKAVKNLQDVIGQSELDASLTTGRQDPYLLRLAVDRQLERQLQEENYLHQAFLNLEKSGRELESIVVGEIQKSYNAYAGILKREAGAAWATVEELRSGPVAMPKDQEWVTFISGNAEFVDPETPIRSFQQIHYPGQNHDACQEIRAGLLERKSKYLKSYTAGWYVLSPTHLHEFKSADKMQAPVMSLYLPEQKLGSHSGESAKSSKFVLKGRQTGSMHRGHTWVFRAESYDTMMAWYEDIKALTEKSPQERNEYAHARGQQHSRSVSRASQYTYSSDGFVNEDDDDDDDDDEPFANGSRAAVTGASVRDPIEEAPPGVAGADSRAATFGTGHRVRQTQQLPPPPSGRRPSPGGRFPSDLQVNAQRGLELQAAGAIPLSPTSAAGSGISVTGSDYVAIAAAGAAPQSQQSQDPGSYAFLQQPPQPQQQQPQQQQPQQQQPQQQQPQQQQPQQKQPYVQPYPLPQQQQQQYSQQYVQQYMEPNLLQQPQPQQQQQYLPYEYTNSQMTSNGVSSQYRRPEFDYQSNDFNVADPQPYDGLSSLAIPSTTVVSTTVNGAAAPSHISGSRVSASSSTLPSYTNPDAGIRNSGGQPLVSQRLENAPLLPADGQSASEAEAVLGREQRAADSSHNTEKKTATTRSDVSVGQGTGCKATETPSVLTRQKSEAVTISNLHIPGGYPRASATGLN